MIRDLGVFAGGYLVGSIPTGLWFGRLVSGIDVRTVGSHRTGATNVQRSLGTGAGIVVLVLDFCKGFASVAIVRLITGDDYLAAVAGVAAVVGHDWPVFAGFRGGRGVATAGGALAALAPLALLLTFVCLAITVGITRYVSLGSIVSGTAAVLIVALLRGHVDLQSDAALIVAILAAGLVLIKHGDNFQRLLRGRETKLGVKPG